MTDTFIFGAYWDSRPESLTAVAHKALQTFIQLRDADEQFLNWYEKGRSKKQAMQRSVSFDAESLERLFKKAVGKSELDEQGFSKNGFVVGFWTGHQDDDVSGSIMFNVGHRFDTPHLSNSVVVDVPYAGGGRNRLLQPEKAKLILQILTAIWQPDYSVLTSNHLRDQLDVGNKIGWITYHRSIEKEPKLSEQIIYEKTEDGHWFYVNPENNHYDEASIQYLIPLKKACMVSGKKTWLLNLFKRQS